MQMSEALQSPDNSPLADCNELMAIVERLNTEYLQQKLQLLSMKIEESVLNLVVLGEFKRGKSTLINALVGFDLLPAGVIPVTSVVTIIKYGQAPQVQVEFDDSKQDRLCEVNLLADFVSETKNPNNDKHVRQATVTFPSPLLKHGVQIVDTPGVGSIHSHNSDVTESFLPQADAAIFVFAADQPATEAELQFLNRMREHAVKFFFVQNKADYLDEADKEQSRNFVIKAITNAIGSSSKVYQVSAKQALRSNDAEFERFKADVFSFLQSERAATVETANSRRLKALTQETADFIALKKAALSLREDELSDAMTGFAISIARLQQAAEKAEHIAVGRSRRIVADISKSLDPFIGENVDALKAWTAGYFESKRNLPLEQLNAEMVEGLKGEIAQVLNPWRDAQERLLQKQFEAIVSESAGECENIVREIDSAAQKYLGVPLAIHLELPQLTNKVSTYITVDDPYTLSIQSIPLLLSGPLAKNRMLKRFLRSAEEEIVRNGGRLRADFQQRVEESTRQFLALLKAALDGERLQLNQLLDDIRVACSSTSSEAQREKTTLIQIESRVTAIQKRVSIRSARAKSENIH